MPNQEKVSNSDATVPEKLAWMKRSLVFRLQLDRLLQWTLAGSSHSCTQSL